MFPNLKSWTVPLAVGAAYYIAAEVGAALAFPSAPVSVLWAPNAIVMAALLLAPREQWWMYLAAIVPFHLFAQLADTPFTQLVIQYLANIGLAALGALAILVISPTPHRFDRVRSAFTLVLFGGLLAPAITSILMATAFVVFGISNEVRLTVVVRTITNTFAVVTLVPLIVHTAGRLRAGQRPISVKRAAEGVTLSLTILAVCVLLFFLPAGSPERTPLLLYAPLPLLAWATVRFGVSGACAASLTAGAISMLAMVNGYGPLDGPDPVENALSLVAFHVVMAIIFLSSAALLDEWRFAGRALNTSRAQFRSIFENNIIPTAIWHDDLRISEANEAFLRLTGFSDADIQDGKLRFEDMATWNGKPGDAESDSNDLLERFDNTELELELRDGRRVPVILGHCRFPADEGGVIYALDLSAFRRAETRRQRVESLHAAVLASLHDQVAVIDSRGTVIEINDSWRHAVDAAPAARFDRVLAGENYLQCCARAAEHGDRTAAEHLSALRAVLNGADDRRQIDCREPSEGEACWFEVSFEKLRRVEGGAVITRTDVTARKRAEADARNQRQQLTHLSRAAVLGQLSGAFAHELKQPLTSILGNAEAALSLLHKGTATDSELREILQDIVQDDERAAGVIQRLRALLGKGDAQRAPVDLNDLVRESLDLVHSEFVTRNVVVSVQLDPALPPVLADRVQMQQVILNLLMNACESMVGVPIASRKAVISTHFLGAAEAAEITVQDHGTGISPGDTERIFQPFVTTKAHGLGLGLAICRSVAESHHGVMWAENAAEGGAIFHMKIPIAGGLP
ncbi:MAG TPA: MASE1 domain-containing protein [Steroidobacteraceae bacterium]|nr:MASE1 domain-containing protein [Steroidobacteraceae bacterium]